MLAIQVTIFSNTGICIGVTHHHSICGGRGFTHFMKTWASISTLESSEPLPLLDRTLIKDHDGITKIFSDELDGFMGSQSMLGNRKLRVMDIKLKPNIEAKTGGSKSNNTSFVVAVNYRARLDPIIPETCFGNCVSGCVVNAEKPDLIQGEIIVAAQLIKSAVQEVEAKKRILKGLENDISNLLKVQSSRRVLAAPGSPQFELYKID
ncbi:hypothetical protein NE237_033277 [Protea cynaroides]|uniref:Uncharacterized protein n=1 Tax=Protea cynaroides TaxID=273540 RepID=A0A9Q0R4P2_9MAGN|nr:hypothetical protein NE237_033277 [Protea cynaroides]